MRSSAGTAPISKVIARYICGSRYKKVRRRDPRAGIGAGSHGQANANIVGMDLAAEEPEFPDLLIDNYGALGEDGAVDLIWDQLVQEDGERSAKTDYFQHRTKAETLEWAGAVDPARQSAATNPLLRWRSGVWIQRVSRHGSVPLLGTIAADRTQQLSLRGWRDRIGSGTLRFRPGRSGTPGIGRRRRTCNRLIRR